MYKLLKNTGVASADVLARPSLPLPHGQGTKVDVSTVGVDSARHRFGVEGHREAKLLGQPMQQVAAHPEVIRGLDPCLRPHLELPLGTISWGEH